MDCVGSRSIKAAERDFKLTAYHFHTYDPAVRNKKTPSSSHHRHCMLRPASQGQIYSEKMGFCTLLFVLKRDKKGITGHWDDSSVTVKPNQLWTGDTFMCMCVFSEWRVVFGRHRAPDTLKCSRDALGCAIVTVQVIYPGHPPHTRAHTHTVVSGCSILTLLQSFCRLLSCERFFFNSRMMHFLRHKDKHKAHAKLKICSNFSEDG